MSENKLDTQDRKKIYVSFSESELDEIDKKAHQCNLSRNQYMRDMILTGNVVNYYPYARIMTCISKLYTLSDGMEDNTLRRQLREGADELWQSLK